MTALFQEPCRFRAQQHGLIILVNQLRQRFLFGWSQLLSLLLEVESFELRSGIIGKAIPGGAPELVVVQELERQLLLVRSNHGNRVEKLRFQTPVRTLGPALEMVVQRGGDSERYCVSGHVSSLWLLPVVMITA